MAKIEIFSDFLKPRQDVNDQDLITFIDEGKTSMSQKFGKQQLTFVVETPNGEQKKLNINNTSKRNLMLNYGDDGANWKGKQARVHIVKSMVEGKLTDIIYLTLPNRDLEGNIIDAGIE